MKINEGFADRTIRIILGLAVLSSPFFLPHSPWLFVALVPFGVVPLLTGIFGVCPLYAMLGVNTRGDQESSGPT